VKANQLKRACEIFPGALSWAALFIPIVFSFFWPSAVALFIVIFDLYWVFRALYMAYFLFTSYKKMRRALRTDFRRMLEALPKDGLIEDWKKVYQVVIYATYREGLDILIPSIESVVENDWPKERKLLVLAGEQRDHDNFVQIAKILKNKFGDKFHSFIISEHPDGLPGEVKGKGSNAAWAGQILSDYIDKVGIKDDKLIVHIADADTRFPRQFLNNVAYEFCINPNRHRRTYQPIPLFSNNIWHSPAMSRLAAWGSSIWQMVEASRPWRLINFSTHAYSMRMLREMDYWAKDVVNEDSRQFWRAYFAFGGDHRAIPIYLPVYMDAVLADKFWTTMKNIYLQKRRWAYGIEHLPYIVKQSILHTEIPFWDKVTRIYRLMEGTISWSTATFYLMFVGWMPLFFSETYRNTVLAFNFPSTIRVLMMVAWIGLALSLYVSLSFLPPRPRNMRKSKYLELIADWIFMPISAIFLSSIPAIDSQTRLMLGKYMTFWVTPKVAAPSSESSVEKT